MSEQPEQQAQAEAWPFAPAYESRYSSLPASQLREAMKRLAGRRRNPLPAEKLAEENPEVAATLEAVERAYLAKKQRAKAASAAKRAAQKAAAVPVEAEQPAVVEDLSASVATLALEPATVAAFEPSSEENPEEEEEESEPEPVKPVPASKPIPIPARVPLARTATEQPAPAPKKVSGLRGRFAVGEPPHPR
jgi:hypothetical protein